MANDENERPQTQQSPQGGPSEGSPQTDRPAADPDLSDYHRRDQFPQTIVMR